MFQNRVSQYAKSYKCSFRTMKRTSWNPFCNKFWNLHNLTACITIYGSHFIHSCYSSSCVWDLLLYYFSKVPQPFHGCWAWVGQVSVRSHRWSEPGAFWQDVVRRLLRGTTQTGCWGAEAPAVHAGTETTYSSAEVFQGDPLSAREISSWWDVCARGDGELCRLCRLLPIMLPLLH